MKLLSNCVYKNDVDKALSANDLGFLQGKSVLITGGTGLIGSAIVDMLLEANARFGRDIRICLAARNRERLQERFGDSPDIRCLPYDALKPIGFTGCYDFIIHCAGNASPELYTAKPVETMLGNIIGMNNLLEYAVRNHCGRVLYLSSSEVYGKKTDEGAFSETSYGYVDLLSTRSSYASAKRATETLCKAYSAEHGTDTVIVRPGHIFGPTASVKDARVASSFARLAAAGKPLQLKSSGLQARSYMYCIDCASAILTVLEKGTNGEAYNISGDEICSILEMAQYLAKAGNVELTYATPTKEELEAFNPMNNSSLCGEKLKALGFAPCFSAEEGFRHTVEILRRC